MNIHNRMGSTQAYTRINAPTAAQDTSLQTPASQAVKKTTQVNLFDANTYQKTVSVDDGTGAKVTLPSLSDEELAQAQSLFAQVPDDKKDAVNAASQALGQALFAQLYAAAPAKLTEDGGSDGASAGGSALSHIGATVKLASTSTTAGVGALISAQTPSPAVVGATQSAASTYGAATGTSGGNGVVMATAYMGVVGLQSELGDFATSMTDTINTKKGYDADYQELNEAVTNWPEGTATQQLPKVTVGQDGTITVTQEALTKEQAQDSAKAAQTASQNTGADQQIQMIQMQQMQSNYSNAVNMISNIMKTGYEMTKNTIGNIHY